MRRLWLACLFLILGHPVATEAQPPAVLDTAALDTLGKGPSPPTAMIRSWLLPGWGQMSVGSHGRAAFFAGAQTTSAYMLFRTIQRLNTAKAFERLATAHAADSLNNFIRSDPGSDEAKRLMDPIAFAQAVGEHPLVADRRGLVEARSQQRQDWITYTIFFTLLSGVDAFVAAHLSDSPVGMTVGEPDADGGFTLRFTVPLGGG